MGRTHNHKNKTGRQFVGAFLLLLQFYLLFHLVFSERSISSYIDLLAQEDVLNQEIAILENNYQDVYADVVRLRPETLDQDMLNEQAMRILGAASDNSVILLDQNS